MKYPVLALAAIAVLAGCGGGGGGGDDGYVAPPEPPTPPAATFQVTGVGPEADQSLPAFPQQVVVDFNRTPDPARVDSMRFMVLQSGGDGQFGNGNETELLATTVTLAGNRVTLDYSGSNLPDDLYQVRVVGEGSEPLLDSGGERLDGDGDGAAGGDFIANFRVDGAMPDPATLSRIQADVLTANCTFSGCHSGAAPAAGMNLTAGQTFLNTVGVASSEVPALQRVEAGNPDDSYLVQKLEGTAAVGQRMPAGRAPLSAAQIATVREWISRGAMND